jgi:hypothetical protein
MLQLGYLLLRHPLDSWRGVKACKEGSSSSVVTRQSSLRTGGCHPSLPRAGHWHRGLLAAGARVPDRWGGIQAVGIATGRYSVRRAVVLPNSMAKRSGS